MFNIMDLEKAIWYNNFDGGIVVDFDNNVIYNYYNDGDNVGTISFNRYIGFNSGLDNFTIDLKEEVIEKYIYDKFEDVENVDITQDDLELIKHQIGGAIANLENELRYQTERLLQTEEITIKIVGGYKIQKPPSDKLKFELNKKIDLINKYLKYLKTVNLKQLIK